MIRTFTIALLFFATLLLSAVCGSGQSPTREELLGQIRVKRSELQTLERQFLAPSSEDQMKFKEFLQLPNRGLVRLLPREVYDAENAEGKEKSVTIRGAGAYYSFTRLTHEYGYGSDISLELRQVSVGFAGCDYGMLFKLGDVPITDIAAEDPRAVFISTYNPPSSEPEARFEQQRFAKGVIVDKGVYKGRLPVEINTTFLLRSIIYEKSDVLIAFRIVRVDCDGSITLVWKMLKEYSLPRLARNN